MFYSCTWSKYARFSYIKLGRLLNYTVVYMIDSRLFFNLVYHTASRVLMDVSGMLPAL